MKSPTKSRVAICAAVSLCLAVTGCGDKKPAAAHLTTISIMTPLLGAQGQGAPAPAADGEVQQAIEKLIGKKLDITWVPNSNYGDRVNVTLASDHLPQVMVMPNKLPAFVQSAQAGAFWDLTDKLGKYPNLKSANKQATFNSSINGRNYGIFRWRDPMRVAVTIRKDWLDKLGLKMPETVDDLYNVAQAFTKDDPDGNGKADTYGLIIPKWPGGTYATASPYDILETWFGAPNGWGERNGKLVPGFDTPEFLNAERFLKKMVDEKLVNPDFATLDSARWNEPFFNGKGGIIIDLSSRGLDVIKLFKQKDPANYGKYVDMTGNLLGPDGKRHSYPTVGYAGFLAISKQSVKTQAELDDVLTVLNKLSSKEGQILMTNGIEGKNFTVKDGYGVMSADPAMKTIINDVGYFGQLNSASNGNLAYAPLPSGDPERKLNDERLAFQKRDLPTAVSNPAQALISPTYVTKGAQLDQIIGDGRIKYLAGQLDEAGLKSEIKRWYAEGGQQIVDEMNQLKAKVK